MKWISFKKEKPKEHQEVMLYFPKYLVSSDFMVVTIYVEAAAEGATHWQPKPEPPDEKQS